MGPLILGRQLQLVKHTSGVQSERSEGMSSKPSTQGWYMGKISHIFFVLPVRSQEADLGTLGAVTNRDRLLPPSDQTHLPNDPPNGRSEYLLRIISILPKIYIHPFLFSRLSLKFPSLSVFALSIFT